MAYVIESGSRAASSGVRLNFLPAALTLSGGAEAEVDWFAPGDFDAVHKMFSYALEEGNSFPQEGPVDAAGFRAYFLSHDVLVCRVKTKRPSKENESADGAAGPDGVPLGEMAVVTSTSAETGAPVGEKAAESAEMKTTIGAVYIKPNFPGRCSHICNGGFLVDPLWRRKGVGSALGEYFVRVAPLLGYRAAFFNLVFAQNTASMRLWEKLGFKKIGLIPRAGRLKGLGFVDAWQYHMEFEGEKEKGDA
uniref:N-acetyltransferase domain-containing protein n=1 Tax=Chromera velia CCMP2878 TaxID=1169474 RepID=A0A0G4I973_9ALVE|mmetsp:Transcript_44276/g.87386  ORF Transcript_44276/g.87386 Transcript_44276/m.87386 type:complete len:249 (-) Transcript_44276:39-785(-)|eukprot:Cvel_12194.t1-p1 / transcript=Cvel_12194.t1 / gene=Cvel_12194 / organism=Chromera_velia_CCMP2878 / gene_product=L-azetidine-2-carboxylic acid acetyltransferase, putative / transcript_product=L-azetidine-2-carboxylic acid acetyltransferase, putative / location=Cvel_scaffold788:27660-30234(-) / protein_length=248 / sequence_SO=supercontig / SO=protein_coding / is_pseudo=false